MAAKVLDDVLNNFLQLDVVLGWLSNSITKNEEKIFLEQYECNQVNFVSHFLFFLREQSSTYFQVFDAETPRKNSRGTKISAAETSSLQSKVQPDFSSSVNHLDLESLQSFPTLSSCSSKTESDKKVLDSTPNQSVNEISNKNSSQKKNRRVKLFSETIDKKPEKEVDFLEDVEFKSIHENRIAVSTPKSTKSDTVPVFDYFNSSDLQAEILPKSGSKPKWKNHCADSSPEINLNAPKSKSFSGNSAHKSKDSKINCRISLGDFILSDISSEKKEKKSKGKKRINPLRLSSSSAVSVNSPFNKSDDLVDNRNSFIEERKILKTNIENVEDKEKEIIFCENPSATSIDSQPEVDLVTHLSELKILSQIYSCLINESYCQNIMTELCFVVSLLVIQDCNRIMTGVELRMSNFRLNKDTFFGSIHNCVYFAVETLWLQRNLLVLLNLSALKLLGENSRIEKFNIKLKEFLVNVYSKKQSCEEVKRPNGLLKTGMQGNVSFQYETDSRENFTSNNNFYSFRKQRDLFYNILAIWEANHLGRGWVFQIGLGTKIRSLFTISSDPINLLHLARLFRNQLIMSCCGENQTEDDFNEDILQLLPSADPNKILRLRARLTSSPKRQGPCPLPDFTGHQEFYKDFILCASHSLFYEHLKNSLCDEILRLNDTELTGDVEDDDSSLDEQTQERYLQCINILRLLAKFLGFIVFLPYQGEKPFSDRIFNIHNSVRLNTLPLFDIVSFLKSAIKKQKLTLTIPWIVSYLSMIDPYSVNLEPYQNVCNLLIVICKHLKTYNNVKNSFYLKLNLGWFFQLPNFPLEQFYSVVDQFYKNPAESLGVSLTDVSKTGLDSYDFVDENILYTVCPFLNEINVILSENSGCSVKHIRPVTTQENLASQLQASKQLELRLESNFFHNQSSSTRKTVEFVTERVASVVIKHLIHNVIPKIKDNAWSQLQNFSTSHLKEAETESESLSESCFNELQRTCEKENWDKSFQRCETALKALLSSELQETVVETCTKIATRQATEKVQRWMQSHLTLAMIKKEFVSLIRKKFAKSTEANNTTLDTSESNPNKSTQKDFYHLPPEGRGVKHLEDAWPASEALKNVRELILKICEEDVSSEEVEGIIKESIKTIKHRNDLLPAVEKSLFTLVVDLVVIFCILFQKDVPQETFKTFFEMIQCTDPQNLQNSNLERIICPRNVAMVFKQAKDKKKAWENLGNLLMSLLDANFLTKDQIEAQLLSFLRQNWEKDDGIQFSYFISQILERYLKHNSCDKFTLLLECMMETLNDDEPKSEN